MKNIFLLILLVSFCTSPASSQVAYYDTDSIFTNCVIVSGNTFKFDPNPINVHKLCSYLNGYLPNSVKNKKDLKDGEVLKQFEENAFFGEQIKELTQGGQSTNLAGPTKFISSIGNANVTSFADGLAKFLVKRAKEELFISVFSKLQEPGKNPEFKILFPQTTILINHFNSWEYGNVIMTIREAFDKDFKALLNNMQGLKNLDPTKYSGTTKKRVEKIQNFLTTTNEGHILLTALELSNGLISGKKIPDIVHVIAGQDYLAGMPLATTDLNVKNSIRLFDILSFSLRNESTNKHYIDKAQFEEIINNTYKKNLFLGLIWQQLKNEDIKFGTVVLADQLSPTQTAVITKYKDYINNLISHGNQFENALSDLIKSKKDGQTELDEYYAKLFREASLTFQSIISLDAINPVIKFPAVFIKTVDLASQTLTIGHDLSIKNYSAAIVGVATLVQNNIGTSNEMDEFINYFVKYGSFAANIVQAKNSDDAEHAIESIALPAGSASIKRKMAWNIALNAYLGGFVGKEYLGTKGTNKTKTILGVYAPVGITFSRGLGAWGSLSVLLNVIDIGAVTAYRLKDPDTETLPKVTLQNILAPGTGIIWGIPGIPISIGYTWQLGPELRGITSTTVMTDKLNSRHQLFIAVDIPLLNFYSKVRK